MAKIVAKCHKLVEGEVLRRSSQIISVIGDQAYIFGGELRPREPRDNDIHAASIDSENAKITSQPATSRSPSPRVGAAACRLKDKIYMFSGRGGPALAPIDEQGGLWEFDPKEASWSYILPSNESAGAVPVARSYHCMASDGDDTLYLHAGCSETGRLSDLWSFNLTQKAWTELSPASGPARGGTSIAIIDGGLYRMNGFDGKTEQGGNLDIYSPKTNSWTSHVYAPDGKEGPSPRSVSCLLPVRLGGRPFLATLFGERDPSSLGHQGAGKMLHDMWAFDIGNQAWEEVSVQGNQHPIARGWFDADVTSTGTIVIHGGLGESNERLGDVWTIDLSSV